MRVSSGDPWRALRGLRIGCVKYLNSRPLICAYDGPVIFEHPSSLAAMLAAGELDAALVPVFEALRDPRYLLVDDVAVGCNRIPELIESEDFGDADLRRCYLTEWLRFDIGQRGREALGLYRTLLAKHRLIASDTAPLEFI